jgi:hypothetical protein
MANPGDWDAVPLDITQQTNGLPWGATLLKRPLAQTSLRWARKRVQSLIAAEFGVKETGGGAGSGENRSAITCVTAVAILILSGYTELNDDQKLPMKQLKLDLPSQPPRRITAPLGKPASPRDPARVVETSEAYH